MPYDALKELPIHVGQKYTQSRLHKWKIQSNRRQPMYGDTYRADSPTVSQEARLLLVQRLPKYRL